MGELGLKVGKSGLCGGVGMMAELRWDGGELGLVGELGHNR